MTFCEIESWTNVVFLHHVILAFQFSGNAKLKKSILMLVERLIYTGIHWPVPIIQNENSCFSHFSSLQMDL